MERAWGAPEEESQAGTTNPSLTPGGGGELCVSAGKPQPKMNEGMNERKNEGLNE